MKKKQSIFWLAGIVAAVIIPLIFSGNYMVNLYSVVCVNLLIVMGLNFITGLTGNMNLGTAGTMAIGAYIGALCTTRLGISPWICLILALVAGFLIGRGLGYPSLRVRGVYLSLTTIAFNEIVRLVINNTRDLTGGAMGVKSIPTFRIFSLEIKRGLPFYYFLLVILVIMVWFSWRIVHSKFGRNFKAIKDNPDAAESLGIDISKVKIQAFTLCSMYAAFAGALYACLMGYINPTFFTFELSIKYVVMLMIGGIGSVGGNIFGAIIVTMLPEMLRFLGNYYQLVFYSIAFIGAINLPDGWPAGVYRIYKKIAAKVKTPKKEG